jgi:PAS domain S-box-containing protein
LQRAYQRLSNHVENTPLAVIEFDKHLNIKRWSKLAEHLFGWTASEVLGKNALVDFPIIYKEDVVAVEETHSELSKGTVNWNQSNNRNYTKDGRVLSCEWYNSVVRNDDGDIETILSLVLDVTERTKTQQKLQQVNAELYSLSSHLQDIRETERTAIAREIHDELGQQLTGLKIDALWVEKKLRNGDKVVQAKLSDMVMLINDTISTVRRISSQLRPVILDDLGLIAALEWQAQENEKRTGIPTHFTSTHSDLELEKGLATNIFRVYQEALTNIARHSAATRVDVTFEKAKDYIELIICDNGRGFELTNARNGSFGLIGMNERAAMINGVLNVSSEVGIGTTVSLRVPIMNTIPNTR